MQKGGLRVVNGRFRNLSHVR